MKNDISSKLNLQDLASLLATKHGLGKKEVEGFVKEFFQLIVEVLEKDRYVKIKGLGTFKLIELESKESVNANAGERFELPAYTKVAFAPDVSLKEIINRPFAHFETVQLNDGVSFEKPLLENEANEEDTVSDVPLNFTKELTTETQVSSVSASQEKVVSTESITQEHKVVDAEKTSFTEYHRKKNTSLFVVRFTATVAVLALLCVGTIIFTQWQKEFSFTTGKPLAENTEQPMDLSRPDIQETAVTDTSVAVIADTIAGNEVTQAVRAHSQHTQEKKVVSEPFIPDSTNYKIIGTQTIYTIQEGETLVRVSMRFYGTKAFWPYLLKHNEDAIKNPDLVPSGITIKIPILEKWEK